MLNSFICVLKFKLGKTILFWSAKIEYTASIAPAAARVCPVYVFVELNSGTSLPKTLKIARPSDKSLLIVAVPCAFI